MNIKKIIESQLQGSWHQFRMLSDDNDNGVFASGYISKDKKRGSDLKRQQERYDLLMVLSGKAIYSDDEVGEILVEAGDCIQRLPGRQHNLIMLEDDWSEFYLCIGKDIYKSLTALSVANGKKPILKTGMDFEMIQLYMEIHRQLTLSNGVELPTLMPKAIELLARATYLDRIHGRTTEETEALKRSIAFIKDNLSKRLTVEDLALNVQMGYEKFRKLFQLYYGVSPGNFIQNQRIRASQSLLSGEDMTVKEVALELGYTDSATFSKQFKKVTGYTPTKFREVYHR